ncbi:uncharacterized protein LOC135125692 [Zophobas morio]|uniref:uncharacterized protein LOC135125692 n=1 Tax=Zophobas morio TaxID=2755281 RepID=UPI0030836192
MLNKEIHKFWELEETAVNTSNSFSVEELTCERHFSETVKRDINGRFMVRLPFKKDITMLGFSDVTALNRFMALETRLNKNNSLKADYTNFLDEYLALGHMKLVAGESDFHTKQLYFFPHHAVIKSSSTTTRVRVVFDGSCKTSTGVSLNNILMVGPTIQQDLFSIITRFRTYQFAFSSDVVKMYRQIWVDPSDTPYQRIFWRKSSDKPVEVYELQTVTYGTACAPYLAIKCLQKLAIDEQLDFPLASTIILRDFYVDDLLTGTNSVKEAIELRNQLIGALNRGGFQLQKWASNCPDILPNCSQNNDVVKLDHNDEVKTLGSTWNCKTDCLKYVVETKPVENTTKRSILSKIARIYDILGLLSPVLVLGKILIQKLWLIKLDWDDPLPEDIRQTWLKLEQELPILNTLQIPRKVVSNQYNNVEIHGFCDASMSAYGACVYIRTLDLNTNSYKTELLCPRSRVSPLKTITLPRLELCAAVLLARLIHKLLPTINLNITTQYMWTDSSIVLSWLASSPSTWNVFVANRVAEISTLTSISNWHHVKSADNPADIVSRGKLPSKLITSDLWWHGPHWLSKNKSEWPASFVSSNAQNVPILEKRAKLKILVVTNNNVLPLLTKYSSFDKLQSVLAYCLRFIHNYVVDRNNKLSGPFSTKELNDATNKIIKLVQASEFLSEIHDLQRGREINKLSKLLKLDPFLDKRGILRVGGRLINADINYEQKFPIVLPSKHHVTKLIILKTHKEQLHAGPAATLAAVREKYWPIAGRSVVRNLLHKCYVCFRANPQSNDQLMGNLPALRVQPSSPFLNCGIDYAGPIVMKEGGRRSKKTTKVYIALFKCFATKAGHIELVTDCTSEAFLSTLKRFMARRGKISTIHSDNATYFTAANKELNKLFHSSQFESEVVQSLAKNNIKWYFIPARSPHRGGFWEAGIKSIKYHLKRVASNALLTYEELYALLTQIEACINSQPLTPLSSDPSDLTALTPGHFLIGGKLTTSVEDDVTMAQSFWKRWSGEFLNTLQQRKKWNRTAKTEVKPGLPVLLREDNLHPMCWRMGVVMETHPGKDGIVRTATIRTSSGPVVRATNRICLFPIDDDTQV